MADSNPSSAPMFTTLRELWFTEDIGVDPIIQHPGANQLLRGAQHDDASTAGPRGNRVQDGSLALLGTHGSLGRPTPSNPTGSQDG